MDAQAISSKFDTHKRRKYFSTHNDKQKKHKKFILETGMTGFLCTCNFREKDCIRDAYELLNEFADKLYGLSDEKLSNEHNHETIVIDNAESIVDNNDEEDISVALHKEIKQLQAERNKPIAIKRFQAVETGVKNVIFINSNIPNPLDLVDKIIMELDQTKKQRTRFILRLLPIQVICKANINEIKLKANELLEKYFSQEPKTFSIVFNRHSNHCIQRSDIINNLADIVNKKNPGNKADLKNPEIAVVVEVIRGLCLMSIAPNYYKFKKYNLLELCGTAEHKETKLEPNKDKEAEEVPELERERRHDVEEVTPSDKSTDVNVGVASEICEG